MMTKGKGKRIERNSGDKVEGMGKDETGWDVMGKKAEIRKMI